jgi:hypothetical protein
MGGLTDDIGIILSTAAFFGIPAWLIYRKLFQPSGPWGSVHCQDCAGSGYTHQGVCTDCEGKGWRWP